MSRMIERARALMERPGTWVDQSDGTYPLRLGGDRRGRVVLTLDEPAFRALIEKPGLKSRPGGGWMAPFRSASAPPASGSGCGSPGQIMGERKLVEPDGHFKSHRANLGESPILWLARRKDASGRPWLTPAEVAAGERLRADSERALRGAAVTMNWDGLPRADSGTRLRHEPSDLALSASARVEQALEACGPRYRSMIEQVCIRGSSLQLAEQSLYLRRRQGKTLLKLGLQALAEHYGY